MVLEQTKSVNDEKKWDHVHFLLESVIFIRNVPVLILLLVDVVVVVVVVVVGPCTTTNAVATDVVIRNNTEVNRMNIILIIMSLCR